MAASTVAQYLAALPADRRATSAPCARRSMRICRMPRLAARSNKEECRRKKRIYAIGQRLSRFGLCACFPGSRRRRRRRCLGSSCSGPELQSALIIEKRFAHGAQLNGATGEERHRRKSREVAVSESETSESIHSEMRRFSARD